MFYTVELLQKSNGPFSLIWKLINDKKWIASRKDLLEANVGSYCSRLLVTLDPEGEHNRSPRFSLYLLAQLSGGVVLLHVKRTELLLKDFEKLKVLVYRKVPKRVEGPDASGTAEINNEFVSKIGKGRRGKKELKIITSPNISFTLDDLNNDLNNRIVESALEFRRIAHPSDITLSEMIPLPRYDDFADDFGVITPEQRRILQETLSNGVGSGNGMPMRGERLIEHSSSSGDRAHELNVVDDRVSAVLAPTEVRTATVQDSVEVSEESGEKGQNSVYDFREEERASVVVQEHVSDPLSSLALEVLSLDDQPSRAPVNVRRRILADEETCLSTRFLRSRMENWADTVRRPREMIMHVPVRGFIDCKELFDRRPATLRRSAQLCELFDGPLRDQISFAFSDADISTSPSAKRRRDEGLHDVDTSSPKLPEKYIMSSEGEEQRISKNKEAFFLSSGSEAHKTSDSLVNTSALDGVQEDERMEESWSPVVISKEGVRRMNVTNAMDEDDDVGYASASRVVFGKSSTRESTASVQERERRSTGFWTPRLDSDDRLSESLVNSDAIEGTNPQNSVENLDSVERPVLSDKHTADELLELIRKVAQRKGEQTVMMSELVDKRSSRLVAARTFSNLLLLLTKKVVTAVQDRPLGDIKITIVEQQQRD